MYIVNFISDRISIHESITKLTSEIIKTCLAKDSKDNLSGMFQNSRLQEYFLPKADI